VQESLTLGEYIRRLRRLSKKNLQQLADDTGLSVSYLSRIENDNAMPNAESVVKLHRALDGDLEVMLEKAACLPEEILDRLARRASQGAAALRRASGDERDDGFVSALVGDMEPKLRDAIADQFNVSADDAEALFEALKQMSTMSPGVRAAATQAIAALARAGAAT